MFVHPLKHPALHHKEARGNIQNLDEPVVVRFIGDKVNVEIQTHLADVLGGSLCNLFLYEIPVDTLLGIDSAGAVPVKLYQAEYGFWVETNVRVDEHHVSELGLLKEPFYEDVPGTFDQRFVTNKIHVDLDPALSTQSLQGNQTRGK